MALARVARTSPSTRAHELRHQRVGRHHAAEHPPAARGRRRHVVQRVLRPGAPHRRRLACAAASTRRRPRRSGTHSRTTSALARTTSSLTINHRPVEWFTQRLTTGNDLTARTTSAYTRAHGAGAAPVLPNPVDQNGGKPSRKRELNVASVDYSGTTGRSRAQHRHQHLGRRAVLPPQHLRARRRAARSFPTAGLRRSTRPPGTSAARHSSTNSTLGFYAQEQLNFNDRLFLTAALRVDDNSAFGDNFSWITYPKVAASWVIERGGVVQPSGDQLAQAARRVRPHRPAAGDVLRPPHLRRRQQRRRDGASRRSTLGNADLKAERAQGDRGRVRRLVPERPVRPRAHGLPEAPPRTRSSPPRSPRRADSPARASRTSARSRTAGIELQLRGNAGADELVRPRRELQLRAQRQRGPDVGAVAGTPLDQQFIGTGNIRHQVGYPVGSYWDRRVVSAEFVARHDQHAQRAVRRRQGRHDGLLRRERQHRRAARLLRPHRSGQRKARSRRRPRSSALPPLRPRGLQDAATCSSTTTIRARCQTSGSASANLNPTDAELEQFGQTRAPACSWRSTTRTTCSATSFYDDASYAKLREISASYIIPEHPSSGAGFSSATFTLSGRNLHTWTSWTRRRPRVVLQRRAVRAHRAGTGAAAAAVRDVVQPHLLTRPRGSSSRTTARWRAPARHAAGAASLLRRSMHGVREAARSRSAPAHRRGNPAAADQRDRHRRRRWSRTSSAPSRATSRRMGTISDEFRDAQANADIWQLDRRTNTASARALRDEHVRRIRRRTRRCRSRGTRPTTRLRLLDGVDRRGGARPRRR